MNEDGDKSVNMDYDEISKVRRLCHQLCLYSCVDEKRRGDHVSLLLERPHWSILKKDEQIRRINLGEEIPFDIALPLPARDKRPDSNSGVKLFWERFCCQQCGKCCYTPGAGLFLEKEDFERIAKRMGKKKLKTFCRYEKNLDAWILKQPCPFYDSDNKGCQIYDIRPATCAKYPLHPPVNEFPYNLAVDAFCPGARDFVKKTLGWWIICENNWARLMGKI